MRATSSAVDAVLFCLLVSAAAGTLAVAPTSAPAQPPAPAETAHVLATSTATVATASPVTTANRTAHGSLAGLLARAATERVAVGGESLTPAGAFAPAVRTVVTRDLRRRVAVRAVWEPYPDAPVRGVAVAGTPPPRAAAVSTATLTVPTAAHSIRERAHRAAAADGYRGVARVAARAVVLTAFPPRETWVAVQDPATEDTVTRRYRRAGSVLGVRVDPGDVTAANAALTRALADRLAADLSQRYDSPAAAARALTVGEVTVVVRTWSR